MIKVINQDNLKSLQNIINILENKNNEEKKVLLKKYINQNNSLIKILSDILFNINKLIDIKKIYIENIYEWNKFKLYIEKKIYFLNKNYHDIIENLSYLKLYLQKDIINICYSYVLIKESRIKIFSYLKKINFIMTKIKYNYLIINDLEEKHYYNLFLLNFFDKKILTDKNNILYNQNQKNEINNNLNIIIEKKNEEHEKIKNIIKCHRINLGKNIFFSEKWSYDLEYIYLPP